MESNLLLDDLSDPGFLDDFQKDDFFDNDFQLEPLEDDLFPNFQNFQRQPPQTFSLPKVTTMPEQELQDFHQILSNNPTLGLQLFFQNPNRPLRFSPAVCFALAQKKQMELQRAQILMLKQALFEKQRAQILRLGQLNFQNTLFQLQLKSPPPPPPTLLNRVSPLAFNSLPAKQPPPPELRFKKQRPLESLYNLVLKQEQEIKHYQRKHKISLDKNIERLTPCLNKKTGGIEIEYPATYHCPKLKTWEVYIKELQRMATQQKALLEHYKQQEQRITYPPERTIFQHSPKKSPNTNQWPNLQLRL